MTNSGKSLGQDISNSFDNLIDQRIVYLLGFGPSWEACVLMSNKLPRDFDPEFSHFTNEHFKQIGVVLAEGLDVDDDDFIRIGQYYYQNFFTLGLKGDGITMRTSYSLKAYYLKKYVLEKLEHRS